MAGIVAYVGRKQAGPIILEGLRRLEYRGYDAAGLAVGTAKAIHVREVGGRLRNLRTAVRLDPVRGTYGIGHTSWISGRSGATGSETVGPGGVALALSGKATNIETLRARVAGVAESPGGTADSAVLARRVAELREDGTPLEEAVRQLSREVEGRCSFATIAQDEPGKVVAARCGMPVLIGLGQNEYFIASDYPAILHRTRDVIHLENWDIAVLTKRGVRVTDADGLPVFRPVHRERWDPLMAEKSGYEHFMAKEIFEQPRAIRETALGRLDEVTGGVVLDELGVTPRELRNISHLNIIGCGSSWHAAMTAKSMIEHLARVHVEIEYGSEFRYSDPLIDESVLSLVLSQSGETADMLASQLLAHERGSKTIAITNSVNSTLAETARGAIYTNAGPELAALSTKSLAAQLTALYLFAMYLGQVRGQLSPEASARCARDLLELPSLVESALELTDLCKRLAHQVSHASKFLFLGRGVQFPIALEGARKMQELAETRAEGCAAGEMRHGPEALINADMFVVMIATVDDSHPNSRLRFEKTLVQVQEVAARHGRVICITNCDDERLREYASEVVLVPSARELVQPAVVLVPLQLLAYHVAVLRGVDIDQPRDIGRSVVAD